MKKYRITVIAFTIFMLLVLPVSYILFKSFGEASIIPSHYTDEELEIYKKIWAGLNSSVDETRGRMFIVFLALWAVMLVLGYIFLIFIYFSQIKPVLELQNYASEISKGNLNVPLPMKKSNGYVDLTESFDLMREQLKSSREREIEAESAKREMVAELSHDLKTPVATIQATCEVLNTRISMKKGNSGSDVSESRIRELEDLEEKIGFITKKADVINELVQSVFRAAVDDMAEIKVSVDEYNSNLIEGYFRGLKDYGNIVIENHIPECLVYMDRLRMEQVVDNIVGNSYKYAGTDIHVSFSETEEISLDSGKKLKYIKITVRDYGPGIPEADMSLVTEKYYRGENSKEKSGYGLGLYLVKNYMERQEGGFEYYNDNGFVTEIYIRKV